MSKADKPLITEQFESPADTAADISRLFMDFIKLSQRDFPVTLPYELLQYNHTIELFQQIAKSQAASPAKMFALQQAFWHELTSIFVKFNHKLARLHESDDDHNRSDKPDPRFTNTIWKENAYFELIKRLHCLVKRYCLDWLHSLEGLDNKTLQQLHFYIINFTNFLSPTNYPWTNPEVIISVIETGGNNLLRGFRNFLEDLVTNHGKLNIRMTDLKAFKVGANLAVTPGKVIFQNDLMQLIQYAPTTESVCTTPVLFVPPWINKYYVLDLSPNNSLVKWLVAQGYTVFMISWVNPDASLADKDFEDYMQEGPIAAVNMITKTLNCDSVNMVGYCIGGTLLASTLAYLGAVDDQRIKSATFFMSLLNFSNPGEIGVFLDEPQVAALDKLMQDTGYLNGSLLDIAFNTLRPNDLIWPYFINRYLLGKPAKPFDLLYWNADSSNQAYKMYSFYLHNMYLKNLLCKPGAITLSNIPIDLGKITVPTFFLSSETDHITLWKSVYSGVKYLNAPTEFVLAESGHVRGVINPPEPNKYGFKTNSKYTLSKEFPSKASEWLEGTQHHIGSWWPYWVEWLRKQDSTMVPARQINSSITIEDAPGTYVLKKV